MDKIYKITFPNGKIYVGRTNDIDDRIYGHRRCAFHKKFNNSIYKAMRKFGDGNWEVEIICEIEPSQSQRVEEEFILAYNSVKGGYNDTYIGHGGDIWKNRRDTEEYMEWIQKMKGVNSSNRMHGKKHSEEAKSKQKEKAKGRFSLEWFIDRNGVEAGQRMYDERRAFLSSRVMKRDEFGNFVKKSD